MNYAVIRWDDGQTTLVMIRHRERLSSKDVVERYAKASDQTLEEIHTFEGPLPVITEYAGSFTLSIRHQTKHRFEKKKRRTKEPNAEKD